MSYRLPSGGVKLLRNVSSSLVQSSLVCTPRMQKASPASILVSLRPQSGSPAGHRLYPICDSGFAQLEAPLFGSVEFLIRALLNDIMNRTRLKPHAGSQCECLVAESFPPCARARGS